MTGPFKIVDVHNKFKFEIALNLSRLCSKGFMFLLMY